MIHIDEVIVVEGKYDKERLKKVTDAPIICTHGFELYRSKRIINTLRKMSKERGIIVLTDSDGAGNRIRGYIKRCLGKDANVKNVYIPRISGKEKRKDKPGAEGILGVEGMDNAVLERILKEVASAKEAVEIKQVSKAEFFADGFSGKEDSGERRKQLARYFNLPNNLSANALLDMINRVYGEEKYKVAVNKIFKNK